MKHFTRTHAQEALIDKEPYLKLSRLKSCLRETVAINDSLIIHFSDNSKLIYIRDANWRKDSLRLHND